MLSSILRILSLALGLVTRWFKKKDDPANQYEKAKSDNVAAVTAGDSSSLNARLDRDLDRLPNDSQRGD